MKVTVSDLRTKEVKCEESQRYVRRCAKLGGYNLLMLHQSPNPGLPCCIVASRSGGTASLSPAIHKQTDVRLDEIEARWKPLTPSALGKAAQEGGSFRDQRADRPAMRLWGGKTHAPRRHNSELNQPRLLLGQASCGSHTAAIIRVVSQSDRVEGRSEWERPRRYQQQHQVAAYIRDLQIRRHTSSILSYLLPHEERTLQPKLAVDSQLCLWRKPSGSEKQLAVHAYSGLGRAMKLIDFGMPTAHHVGERLASSDGSKTPSRPEGSPDWLIRL